MSIYSRANTYKHIQLNMRKDGTHPQYFDLPNGDKLLVSIRKGMMVNALLISGNRNKSDKHLLAVKIGGNWTISNIANTLDSCVQDSCSDRNSTINKIITSNHETFENSSLIDFDSMKPGYLD